MKKIKCLCLVFVIIISLTMPLNSYALSTNGLSVSDNSLTQGDEFEVYINIPANSENADTASLKVEFDSSAFEVKSWEPVVSGGTAGKGEGYFSLAAANAERKIDLSKGLSLTATLKAKNTAKNGSYDIKLTKSSISYVSDNGYEYVELWSPEVKSINVKVATEQTTTVPAKDDITVSKSNLKPNDEFEVYINVPANPQNADTASLKVEFDSSAFEVKSWEPVISGGTAGKGEGYFSLAAANAERKIDLSNGLTLTATLKVKSAANNGSYAIKLTKSSFSYVADNGYEYIELWSPEVKNVNVKVNAEPTTTVPAKDDITVSKKDLKPDDEFEVYINIPTNSQKADTASLKVEFDASTFEVKSWEPVISGGTAGKGDGYFSLAAANAERKIDLSKGLTLTATLKVKSTAKNGSYDIRLTKNSFSYVADNGYEYVELWSPAVKKATVKVTVPAEVTTPTTTTTTPICDSSPSDDEEPEDEKPVVSTDETTTTTPPGFFTTPQRTTTASTTASTKKTTTETVEDEESIYDEEPEDEEPTVKDDIELSLSNELENLTKGKVTISSKYRFFSNDSTIILSHTNYAEECAEAAAENLGLENHLCYAFDISVYDEEREKFLSSLKNDGYIDFAIPIPEELSENTKNLRVYHIESGYPEKIESEIVTVDGVRKITFRADSFSPYMIIDTVNECESYIITDKGEEIPTTGNVNPNTGAAMAITIPTALVGCALLVKKNRRKRGKNRKV